MRVAISFLVDFLSRAVHCLFSFNESCRFVPSCSKYLKNAISMYGIAKGSLLGFRRILRCSFFGPYGYDELPSNGGNR